MSEEKKEVTFHYFGVKARGFPAVVGGAYWGKELVWEKYSFDDWKNNKNEIKSHCSFGQLPVLHDNGSWLPQSMAIVRYLGKKWKKEGSSMEDFLLSETLIEESKDILNLLVEAKYGGKNTPAAWDTALSKMPKHLENLQKLMTGTRFASEVLMGDMAIFGSINMVLDNNPHILDNYTNLKTWYDGIASKDAVKAVLNSSTIYLKKPDGEEKKSEFTLYSNKLCPFAHRAWMAALEKGVPFDFELIPLSVELKQMATDLVAFKKKNSQWSTCSLNYDGILKIKEDYKANMNPSGAVPCIMHDGKIILESDVCAEYLDNAFPNQGTRLIPEDSYLKAKLRMMIKAFNVGPLYGLLKNQDPSKDEEFRNKIYKFHEIFVRHADPTGPFFFGANFSLAECIVCPFYDRFRYLLKHYRGVDYIPSDTKIYPWAARMLRWAEAVNENKSFQATTLGGQIYIDNFKSFAGDRSSPSSS